jgi:hypothetical protein
MAAKKRTPTKKAPLAKGNEMAQDDQALFEEYDRTFGAIEMATSELNYQLQELFEELGGHPVNHRRSSTVMMSHERRSEERHRAGGAAETGRRA